MAKRPKKVSRNRHPARHAAVTQQRPKSKAPLAIDLPVAVWNVLYDIQNQLFQVKGVFASAYALAESNDDSSDVRYALEAALSMFDPVIESVEPACVTRAAAGEVSDGR